LASDENCALLLCQYGYLNKITEFMKIDNSEIRRWASVALDKIVSGNIFSMKILKLFGNSFKLFGNNFNLSNKE
jgi:hypothetical protein